MDPVDCFDSLLHLEEIQKTKGYENGYNEGLISGKQDGREVGLKTGFEVGEELGFYLGCVDIWKAAIVVDPTRFSTRVQKSIGQIEDLIEKYPIMDPKKETVQEIMEALRLKFRVIRAALGVKLDYDGYLKPRDIEF